MTAEFHSYEPSEGHGLAHDPFNAIVGPRPIGWISSKDRHGNINLAPHSFFNAFNYKPPIIGFFHHGVEGYGPQCRAGPRIRLEPGDEVAG